MSSTTPWVFIDDKVTLRTILSELTELQSTKPDIFIDLEGENLSKVGRISIMQLFYFPKLRVYLLDILKLGKAAFTTPNDAGVTLKHILETENIRKAIFDVRNNSAALYHQYGISLDGVDDIQLMELAARPRGGKHVNGLARCIERDAALSLSQRKSWLAMKDSGKKLFEPKLGGSYAVFNERPLKEEVKRYWDMYSRKLSEFWQTRVATEVRSRIVSSQSSSFNGKGQHMALAPSAWRNLREHRPFIPGFLGQSLPVTELKRALETMQTLHDSSSISEAGGSCIMKPDVSVDLLIKTFEATKLTTADLSSVDKISGPKQEYQSESLIPVTTVDSNENRDSELRLQSHPWANPMEAAFSYNDDRDRFFFNDNEDSPDFTACSAEDCGYCGHCDY